MSPTLPNADEDGTDVGHHHHDIDKTALATVPSTEGDSAMTTAQRTSVGGILYVTKAVSSFNRNLKKADSHANLHHTTNLQQFRTRLLEKGDGSILLSWRRY